MWVYRSDLAGEPAAAPGALVGVVDDHGRVLGSAFYSTASQIALRMLSPQLLAPADVPGLLRQRIDVAIRFRQQVVADSDAFRIVFSEADLLPGVIADRYNDLLAVQFLTQATDQPQFRDLLLESLQQHFHPAAVHERVEPRIRALEQLSPRPSGPLTGDKSETVFTMNEVRFHYQAGEGQKTGAFLDQRENYPAAAAYAHGDALDVFTYQGGFALHLARRCPRVTAVDSSRPALEMAERNEQLNRQHHANDIEWIEANAFDLLKDYAAEGRQYDTIVLDPPAFAKTRRDLDAALRGYKELNLRALKMLRPGGLLVTCSCSYHVREEEFLEIVRSATVDARRSLRLLDKRTQAKDHPILLTVPETQYLKCLLLQIA